VERGLKMKVPMMKTTMMGSLVLTMALAACSGSADDPTSPAGGTGTGTETNPSTPGAGTTGSAPEYNVSCHGDVSKQNIGSIGATPLCVGGEPGTFCGDDPCAPQAIEIRYEPPAYKCGSTTVWAWDGSACKGYPTSSNGGAMKCKGTGCEKLYKSESDCKAAYASCAAK
jgi:hypothetical protein